MSQPSTVGAFPAGQGSLSRARMSVTSWGEVMISGLAASLAGQRALKAATASSISRTDGSARVTSSQTSARALMASRSK